MSWFSDVVDSVTSTVSDAVSSVADVVTENPSLLLAAGAAYATGGASLAAEAGAAEAAGVWGAAETAAAVAEGADWFNIARATTQGIQALTAIDRARYVSNTRADIAENAAKRAENAAKRAEVVAQKSRDYQAGLAQQQTDMLRTAQTRAGIKDNAALPSGMRRAGPTESQPYLAPPKFDFTVFVGVGIVGIVLMFFIGLMRK